MFSANFWLHITIIVYKYLLVHRVRVVFICKSTFQQIINIKVEPIDDVEQEKKKWRSPQEKPINVGIFVGPGRIMDHRWLFTPFSFPTENQKKLLFLLIPHQIATSFIFGIISIIK